VCTGERLGLTARLDPGHLLLTGEPRQILHVTAVDSHAPHAADEELTIARPQVPRKSRHVVDGPDEEERS